MDKLLLKLYTHTNEAINKKENDIIAKNIELLMELFGLILECSKSLSKSSIFHNFDKYINDLGIRMLNEGLYSDTIKYMNAIYDIYNKQHKKEYVYIFQVDIFHKLYNLIEDLQNFKFISDLRIKRLLYNLIRNSGEHNGFVIDHYAPQMCSAFYLAVFNNRFLDEDEKSKLIFDVLDDTIYYGYSSEIKNDKNKIAVFERSILYLLKSMIDKLDLKRLSDSLIKILKNSHHYRDIINIQKILLHVFVYLYYLVYKEDKEIVPEKNKEMYVNFLKSEQVKGFYNILKSYSHEMWSYYLEIKSALDKWERFGIGEAKFLIMKNVVKEFFLFFSIASREFNLDKINKATEVFGELDIFSFLDNYLDGNDFNSKVFDSYSVFLETFDFESGATKYDMNVLKNQLLSAYKSIQFNKLKNYLENKEVININIKNMKESILNSIKDSPYIKLAKAPIIKSKNRVDKEFRFNIRLSTYFIGDREETDHEYLIKDFNNELERHILNAFIESGFIYKRLDYSYSNKINELLESVESIQSEEGNTVNVFISGIPTDSHILYMESDTDKQNLSNFITKIKYLEKTDKLLWLGFDATNLKLLVHDTRIEDGRISDQEINEILNQCKKGEKYSINITNNIFVPFTRDEAIEFLTMKNYVIRIKIKYSILFEKSVPGFFVEIGFD